MSSSIHKKIECILEEFANQEINLSSAAARKMLADKIMSECLSKGKTILLDEIKTLRENQQKSWPPSDIYFNAFEA